MPAYKNEARHTWYCSFYYQDNTGKRRKKKKEGFATRREALEFERDFLQHYTDSPEIFCRAVFDLYTEDMRLRLKPTTFNVKSRILNNRIRPFFDNIRLTDVTSQTVNDWKKSLLQLNLKPSYLKTIYTLLVTAFNFAMENYNLSANPALKAKGFNLRMEKEISFWTLAEFQQFAMTLTNPIDITAFYLLFWTGCRVGEILALTWEDIDLLAGTISISKTYSRIAKQDIITTPKTASSARIVTLPRFITAMLKDYQQISSYIGADRIIPVTRDCLLRRLNINSKKIGLKKISLHDLRHSHASMLINAGLSPVDVADRLGHKDSSLTLKVYSHFYEAKRRIIADKLETMY